MRLIQVITSLLTALAVHADDFTYQDILIATYPDNSILEVNGVNVQTSLDIVDALYKIKSWRIKGVTRESDKAIEICECQEHPMWKYLRINDKVIAYYPRFASLVVNNYIIDTHDDRIFDGPYFEWSISSTSTGYETISALDAAADTSRLFKDLSHNFPTKKHEEGGHARAVVVRSLLAITQLPLINKVPDVLRPKLSDEAVTLSMRSKMLDAYIHGMGMDSPITEEASSLTLFESMRTGDILQ